MELKIYFGKLPDETVTNILVLATTTTKQTTDTYHSLFRTCRILSTILEQRQREILPRYPTYAANLCICSKNFEILRPV